MGWVMMSERDLKRMSVLKEVETGRLRATDAAALLDLSRRQLHRLLTRFRAEGVPGLAHRARGRSPNNMIDPARRTEILALVRTQFSDFGPSFAAEKLAELHGIAISRETLRKWMIADGLWASRKYRRQLHQPRLRREAFGELIQIDGSEHRWFEDRGEVFSPAPETLVCRCECQSADAIRSAAARGAADPNQVKIATRAGMGPCQGRQCGYTVAALVAEAHGQPMGSVGYLNIRAPLKPITLGEARTLGEA